MTRRITAVILIVAALIGLLVWSQHRSDPAQVSGFLESDEIRVGSRVGGRVLRVVATEGRHVKSGELLVELDPYNLLEQRDSIKGKLAQAQEDFKRLSAGYRKEEVAQSQARRDQMAADLEKLRNGPRPQEIAAAEARVEDAKANVDLAKLTLARVTKSYESKAASDEEFDRAKSDLQAATARMGVRTQELELLKAGTRAEEIAHGEAALGEMDASLAMMQSGYRAEDVAKAKAAVDTAAADLASIEKQLTELNVKAPIDAVVEAVDLRPGDLIAPNAPVLSLIDPSNLWVRAYVPEGRMNVRLDQPVRVRVDSFPDKTFAAKITFISTQAEFTPSNVQTPEERSKQVFRIKATLSEGLDVLRAGTPADVLLDESK